MLGARVMVRRIAVIGGGVIGSSVAWHLAGRNGIQVLLLERDRIGSGTTWHSAGNIIWTPNDTEDEPIRYMIDEVIPSVAREGDQDTGWLLTGRLFLARTEPTLASLAAQAEEGARRGVESRMIGAAEIARRNPLLDARRIAGCWYNAKVGRLNPADLTSALVRAARRRGAEIAEGCAVTGISVEHGRVVSLATGTGTLPVDGLVVCAGLWSRRLLAPLGMPLGQWGCEHFYAIARTEERLPRETPSFVSADDLIYGREEVGGLLFGAFDEDALTLDGGAPPDHFSYSLLPENWDKFGPYAERAVELFPALRTASIQRFVNGPEAFTPDGRPLIGPAAGIDGLWIASAFNSGGVNYAGLAGQIVSDLVAETAPRFNPAAFLPDRFGDAPRNEGWLRRTVSGSPSAHYRELNVH